MRLFFDNCIAPKHVRALAALWDDHILVHLREKFAPNITDQEWLPRLKSEGDWVVLSGDFNIVRKRRTLAVWRECALTSFFLVDGWQELPMPQQHAKLTIVLGDILARAARAPAGSAFRVRMRGAIDPVPWA